MNDRAYCTNFEHGQRRIELETEWANYRGTGVDFMCCPACGWEFQVTYQIHTITRVDPQTWKPIGLPMGQG
jgi:hypothetical protein